MFAPLSFRPLGGGGVFGIVGAAVIEVIHSPSECFFSETVTEESTRVE